jgi:hypothetical protein
MTKYLTTLAVLLIVFSACNYPAPTPRVTPTNTSAPHWTETPTQIVLTPTEIVLTYTPKPTPFIGVTLPPTDEATATALPPTATPTFEPTPNGIKVEPKEKVCERLGRSTNCGDAVIMAWFEGERHATAAMDWMEDAQWKLGAELTQDGIECNIGNAAGCKIFSVLKNKPMTLVKATDADNARARAILADTVLPGWVKRCGPRCGEAYNDFVAPIAGVRYRAP